MRRFFFNPQRSNLIRRRSEDTTQLEFYESSEDDSFITTENDLDIQTE